MKAIAKVITRFSSGSIAKVMLCSTPDILQNIKDMNSQELLDVQLLDTEETSQVQSDVWNKAFIQLNGNIEFENGTIIGSELKMSLIA